MTKLNESKLIEKGKLNSLSESSETIKKLKNLKNKKILETLKDFQHSFTSYRSGNFSFLGVNFLPSQ